MLIPATGLLHQGALQSIWRALLVAMPMTMISACGGGGGGGAAPPPPPPPPPTSGWQQGVFQPSDSFANRCAAPRSGTDPATGQPFLDIQGTVLDENNFLRSFSDETYLWYDEITDRNPGTFNDPLVYFDLLKTNAVTPSGAPKDKFHFTFDSEEWFNLSQGGVSAGYGAEIVVLASLPPRDIRIAFTNPNTPATAAGLTRGAEILFVDGVDVVNDNTPAGVNTIIAAIEPATVGVKRMNLWCGIWVRRAPARSR